MQKGRELLQPRGRLFLGTAALAASLALASVSRADEVAVAVAANFLEPLKALEEPFHKSSGHTLRVSPGSSGELFAQIQNGAPFDVFLSADQDRPKKLESLGLAVAASRFTYSIGKLALWSADAGTIPPDGGLAFLKAGTFRHLVIANPETAPYGVAAMQVLEHLDLAEMLKPKLVLGQSISQTFQFVATKNAEIGFVALSQLVGQGKAAAGSRWDVPQHLYDPIRQDGVLLARAKDKAAARVFMEFLRGAEARRVIRELGYDVEGR